MDMHHMAVHPPKLYGKLGAYVSSPGKMDHCFLKFSIEIHDQNYFYILKKGK